jgi:hypothetical protein
VRDFTTKMFENLCVALKQAEYEFITFSDFCSHPHPERFAIMRHDVDRDPQCASTIAALEKQLGIKSSYYFRIIKSSYDRDIILKIASMGHEIGYHYEDLSTAHGVSFRRNLSLLRNLYPVRTICMHGSPLSKWDNRYLWQHYNYRDFGIVGEPYFDVDFNDVCYLTDTGRSWNDVGSSMRDTVKNAAHSCRFEYTSDIIDALQYHDSPNRLMFNIHPQRWRDHYIPWFRELIWQNTKNIGKRILRMRI